MAVEVLGVSTRVGHRRCTHAIKLAFLHLMHDKYISFTEIKYYHIKHYIHKNEQLLTQ